MKKYESLAELIKPYIDKPFDAMPDELRKRVTDALLTMRNWDELKPPERLSLALQHDEFKKAWELDNAIEDVQSEIDRCKSIVPVSHADDVLGQTRISELEAKKAEIERQYLVLKGEVPESMPVVQSTDLPDVENPVTNETPDEPANQTEADGNKSPAPLTTKDIAFGFSGLNNWDEEGWKEALGSAKNWLKDCQCCPGTRGRRGVQSTWNPVLIGAALLSKGKSEQRTIRARFQTRAPLKPWFDLWKTYEADNLEAP